jgi:hypothetical protein
MSDAPPEPAPPVRFPPPREQTIGLCVDKLWMVNLTCKGCGRRVVWSGERLRSLPRRLTLSALARSGECTACGHVGATVWPTQDRGAAHLRDLARLAAEDAKRPAEGRG